MPYKKINQKIKEESTNQAANDHKLQPAPQPLLYRHRHASALGAEGASASMADRAVRAARL
jgi:hypothetical protein